MIPKFSICIIAKNEANTLPKLFLSLEDFKRRGGEVCILDTGSTDDTKKIAIDWGAEVYSGRFERSLHEQLAKSINKKFVAGKDAPIVEANRTLFNFSEARNYINSKASNDMICTLDADEAYTVFDIDKINEAIDEGFEQFEYKFIYAHDQYGKPAIEFVQSKFFNRKKAKWTGIVHEVVTGPTKLKYLDETIIRLEHFQEPGKEHRGGYLPGLALDCFENPDKDRQSHYFARELMYSGRWESSIKEFQHHIKMGGWPAERAQSMIHMAHCFGMLNRPDDQLDFLHRAFDLDSSRRASLIELGLFMRANNNALACMAYTTAAMQIGWKDYYANDKGHYEHVPHELLYWAKGWLGDVEGSKEHLIKALRFQQYNPIYLRDTKFYFEYPDNGITGWMVFEELQWLYETAKTKRTIVEVGSWKGKSTHALLSGQMIGLNSGTVTAVDTWQGSTDVKDMTNYLAKQEDVFATFKNNVGDFANLRIVKKTSVEAAKDFEDDSIDFLFLDAGHTKENLSEDLDAWLPKMKPDGLISGHDYMPDVWMGVIEAVDERFGKPDGVAGLTIWYVDLAQRPTSTVINTTSTVTPNSLYSSVIPKNIYSCWLNENKVPDHIRKCLDSQNIPGYTYEVITLSNVHLYSHSPYVQDAINAKKWVKATDYLRMVCLGKGGIFLDADVEILDGKNFDSLLQEQMFVGKEVNNPDGSIVIGTAVIGARPEHPLILKWLNEVITKFHGDDDFNYESSMDLLNLLGVDYQDQMRIVEPDVFYPFYWRTGELKITDDTIAIHQFNRSWIVNTQKNYAQLTGYIGWPVTLEKMAEAIKKADNFTFVKRGDGEEACMNGEQGANCDGHNYSEPLAVGLRRAFSFFEKNNCIVVKFEDQQIYNSLLHRTDNDPSIFWKQVIKSERPKYFIGPARLSTAAKFLDAVHVEIPLSNAFDTVDIRNLDALIRRPNGIYIFCAGMPAKLWIHQLRYLMGNTATFIDAGSSFDSLAGVGQTRTFQVSESEFWNMYESIILTPSKSTAAKKFERLLMQDEPVNNFKLDQKTHPERLFVLEHITDQDESIIDLGCGSHKTHAKATGMDIRPGVTDLTGTIEDVPAENETYDVAISRHSLEHVLDPVKAIRDWMRVLKPNSKIIIVLPDHGKINTIDPYYSNGEHLHAYSIESFKSFISLFPALYMHSIGVVMENWSFGTVLHYKLPKVSIIIPSLGRPEGLKRCKESIANLLYPQKLIEILEIEGPETVPQKMASGFKAADGDIICYAANDMEFTPNSLLRAVEMSKNFGLVAFNTGELLPDEGNICEHFIIRRDFVQDSLNNIIFDTRLKHCGVDNLLWAQAKKRKQAARCENAIVKHYHFSRGGKMDEVYEKGWKHVDQDRANLRKIMENY